MVKAVAPQPVNVLVSAPNPDLSVDRLASLGVRRISVGSALARVAWGAFMRSAQSIRNSGSFDSFAGAAPFSEIDEVMNRK
jgi:2-methylisocitrate lyase-like PEP mutase family enzyme